MIHTLFRVQAADGRGPWRPGLSKHWVDESTNRPRHPDIIAAFGTDWLNEIPPQMYRGCACRSLEALFKWFTSIEMGRLAGMGYHPVALAAERIIRENEDQVIFARRDPLHVNVVQLAWPVPQP